MGPSTARPTDRGHIRMLLAIHRLCQRRRASSGNEPNTLGLRGHSNSERPGHCSLFHFAETAVQCLPAMWMCHPDRIQFLPTVQLQTEPKLSAMPACDWRKLCLLPLLWNFVTRSDGYVGVLML